MKTSESLVFYAIFIVVVLIVTGGFVFHRVPPEFKPVYITPLEAKNLIERDGNVVVIDVSPYFFASGHLPGALNYPKCTISNLVSGFDKDRTYLIYCHGFGSPMRSVYRLKEAGFERVYALSGNFGAWVDAGYPVEN